MEAARQCIHIPFLCSLDDNDIGVEGAKALAEALKGNSSLTALKYGTCSQIVKGSGHEVERQAAHPSFLPLFL